MADTPGFLLVPPAHGLRPILKLTKGKYGYAEKPWGSPRAARERAAEPRKKGRLNLPTGNAPTQYVLLSAAVAFVFAAVTVRVSPAGTMLLAPKPLLDELQVRLFCKVRRNKLPPRLALVQCLAGAAEQRKEVHGCRTYSR